MFIIIQATIIAPVYANHQDDVLISVNQNSEKEFVIEDFTIKTSSSGQVPFYFFWNNNQSDSTYRVQFNLIFEAEDVNGDNTFDDGDNRIAGSVMSLSSLDWEFGEIMNETNSEDEITNIHFNMTGTDNRAGSDDFYIQFRNHIDLENNENELKFDIVINNYDWKDDSAILVLGYKIQSTHPNFNGETNQNGQTIQFGEGYFESEGTAQDDNGTIVSGLSSGSEQGENDPFIYISYAHFDGELVHDPTIGVHASVVDDEAGILGSIELLFIASIAIAVSVLLRRYRN
jgi:hypothetical protein